MSTDKSWQARISEATDALAQSFVESISYDRRMYRQDIMGSIAHAAMLAKSGLITQDEREAIVAGLREIEQEIEQGKFVFDESLEDIHMVIEDALTKRCEAGKKLHTGRSRNDQVALDLSLWVRDAAHELADKVDDLCRAMVQLAARSRGVVMPSYTHLQRAQPIDAAAEGLAWCTMFARDAQRLRDSAVFKDVHDSPLGSGAVAGTSLPIDSYVSANLLGFANPPRSGIEQTASRDMALEMLFALSMTAMHLSRLAEQWIIYMSTEFSFLKIADRYTTGSSMMPQKRNPDMLELIRGRCGCVYGDLVALLTIMKGLPLAYNRDLQEDKRILFRAYDTVTSCVVMAAAVAATAEYNKAAIEPTLERGFLDATSLAEYLVTKGIPFRTAHQIVGALVSRCEKEGKHSLTQLKVDDFKQAAKSAGATADIAPDVFDSLGAANVVKRYRSAGAGGGEALETQLENWKRRLGLS